MKNFFIKLASNNQKSNKNINKNNKIVITNKFKKHMESHKNDFVIDYKDIIKYADDEGYFTNLKGKGREIVVLEFPKVIGFSSCIKTDDNSEIIYAKRLNRNDCYTRFVISANVIATNKCTIILNKSKPNKNEYYLITIFPTEGEFEKEPQDPSIKTTDEMSRSLKFWNNHALIFDESIVQKETIVKQCPYSKLYKNMKN